MAVKFACRACGQALEVDEALAGREVMCPFCRAVVRAEVGAVKAEGTETATGSAGGVEVGSAAAGPEAGADAARAEEARLEEAGAEVRAVAADRRAWVCLLLAVLAWCGMLGFVAALQVTVGFPEVVEEDGGAGAQEEFERMAEERPGLFAILDAVATLSVVVALIALIPGIAALRGGGGSRGPAIIGLIMASIIVMCPVLGWLL